MTETYMDALVAGRALPSEMPERVQQWHEADTELPVFAWLGMTEDEYLHCCMDDAKLVTIVMNRREAERPRFVNDPTSPSRILARELTRVDDNFHSDLVSAREQRMSTADVAIKLGWSLAEVEAFETGADDAPLSRYRRYAHAIGVSYTHVVGDADADPIEQD